MTTVEFAGVLGERVRQCKELTLGTKDKEYTRNGDKLWNFKRAGQIIGMDPAHALLGMMSKHLASVFDIVEDVTTGHSVPKATFDEKFSDLHNYLFLLEALLQEQREGTDENRGN